MILILIMTLCCKSSKYSNVNPNSKYLFCIVFDNICIRIRIQNKI
jgi:hypothetical protein